MPVPADSAGPDPNAVSRAGRRPGAIAYLMPTGHNPTGAVMPLVRRQAFAAIADAGRVTVAGRAEHARRRGCADGEHRQFARLSFAEQPGTLELAAERLAAAWELHAENLAASPVGVSSLYP